MVGAPWADGLDEGGDPLRRQGRVYAYEVQSGPPRLVLEFDEGGWADYGGNLEFGATGIGLAITVNARIRNLGMEEATLTYVGLGGSHPDDFSVTPVADGTTIGGGQALPVTIEFVPGVAGPRDALLAVATDVSSQLLLVNLVGTAGIFSDGTLDIGFGDRGFSQTFGPIPNEIKTLPDGRILIAGNELVDGYNWLSLSRQLPDGRPDPGFGFNGKARLLPIHSGGLVLLDDGRILVAGAYDSGTNDQIVVMRCLPDGSFDGSFANGGVVFVPINADYVTVSDLAIGGDGSITVGGKGIFTSKDDLFLARLQPDGVPDPGFGTGGIASFEIAGSSEALTALAIQPNGKAVISAYSIQSPGPYISRILRVRTDGTLDPEFGDGGSVTEALPSGQFGPSSMVLEPDGGIVAAWSMWASGASGLRVSRLDAAGSPDPGFGSGGTTSILFNADYMLPPLLFRQADGRLVVAGGMSVPWPKNYSPALARLEANGTLDPGFGVGGRVELTFDYPFVLPYSIATQGDGVLLLGVQSQASGPQITGLIRLADSASVPSAVERFASNAAAFSLTDDDALPDATPFNEGVEILLKYAFNMNLAGPDTSSMTPGGNKGLPGGELVEIDGQTYWQIQFVRRRGSGLVYSPKKSSTLEPGSFLPLEATPFIESIDGEWDRVIYNEPCDPATESRCFSLVEVTIP